jgi:aminomethyltransferase
MKRTIFYDEMKKMNAFMAGFGSWEMPIYFSGIKDEHFAVRENVGVFDVSHMNFVSVEGENADKFLNKIISINIETRNIGTANYAVICNENAGILDDIIVYKKNSSDFFIIVNSENGDKILDFLLARKKILSFSSLEIKIHKKIILALQGPKSPDIIKKIFSLENSNKVLNLEYYSFCEINDLNNDEIIVARTGYTGEIGFEIIIPLKEDTKSIFDFWDKLKILGVKPCGLGSRDVLRLEAGYSLYGHELTEETNPLDAGLAWIVDLEKEDDFLGKDILIEQKKKGIEKKIVALEVCDKKFIPRHGAEIFVNSEKVGFVTSGTFSFFLDKSIALAYLSSNLNIGDEVEVLIRNKKITAKIVKNRFYYNPKIKEKII